VFINVWHDLYSVKYAFQTETDESADEEYDPKKDVKRRRLGTSKAGAKKAGSTGNRMSGGVVRSYSKSNGTVKGAAKVAGRVGMVVKTTATATGPIGAMPGLTLAAPVSTLTPVVNTTTEVSNLTLHYIRILMSNACDICLIIIIIIMKLTWEQKVNCIFLLVLSVPRENLNDRPGRFSWHVDGGGLPLPSPGFACRARSFPFPIWEGY